MQLRVEGSALTYTSGQLRSLASATRELAGSMRRAGSLEIDVHVDRGVRQVAGVGCDALDLVAADLELLVSLLRAGNRLYDDVEDAAAAAGDTGARQP